MCHSSCARLGAGAGWEDAGWPAPLGARACRKSRLVARSPSMLITPRALKGAQSTGPAALLALLPLVDAALQAAAAAIAKPGRRLLAHVTIMAPDQARRSLARIKTHVTRESAIRPLLKKRAASLQLQRCRHDTFAVPQALRSRAKHSIFCSPVPRTVTRRGGLSRAISCAAASRGAYFASTRGQQHAAAAGAGCWPRKPRAGSLDTWISGLGGPLPGCRGSPGRSGARGAGRRQHQRHWAAGPPRAPGGRAWWPILLAAAPRLPGRAQGARQQGAHGAPADRVSGVQH